ncbi:cytidine deaminase [Corynebacterium phocae]|uniref:Cytidine deaminase n=1 Tax=Corynebacterium phocae TaxID=161895 RepID=A0A1L7D2B8_9CORY|nr:cytidine deaminase [Corynebacterium phocae]APT92172.1 cytidine deaminase [Corynebacterium phocae]KAA8725959.1 cytidine deaminase [Corynebacterium phocae]
MKTSPLELLEAARDAAGHAYAPYSQFPVGAVIEMQDGTRYDGCNVENASYGLTLCAERNAITTMIAQTTGTNPAARRIKRVAIVGLKAKPCWPCGACRQVLREFGTQEVIVEGDGGEPLVTSFEELLPHSFGPEDLGS